MFKRIIIMLFEMYLPGWCLSGLLVFCLAFPPMPLHAMQITLNVADIAAPNFSARGVRAVLKQEGSAEFSIAELHLAEKTWRKVHLYCTEFLLNSVQVACLKGKLDPIPDLSVTFHYEIAQQRLDLRLAAKAQESWQVSADFRARPWHATVRLHNAQARRLAGWLPPDGPLPAQGTLSGTLAVQGDQAGVRQVRADLQLAGLAAADASGLHAAEKLGGILQADAARAGKIWDWRGKLEWQEGELFWQPLYLRSGYTLQAAGWWGDGRLGVTGAVATLPEVGKIKLSALWDMQKGALLEGQVTGKHLSLAAGFANYGKPFLENSALVAAGLKGHADVDWQYRNGATQALLLKLRDVAVEDGEKRFALHGINADIPWHAQAQGMARLSFADSELMGLPLGATQLTMQMRGKEFTMPAAILPILDGKLVISDFYMHGVNDTWQWNFSNTLTPISMEKLSAALSWPAMHGTLSGYIPRVSYRDKLIKVDGTLLFRVFDGTVEADHLELFDPFGRASRVSGNLDARDLDLDLLTRTFSFGNIQGRIDLGVNNLELVNWHPARFDARLASSPGKYRKRISQKAVENISSLGGAGGGAALQRSFLRIFETFGYDRIGLGCELRNETCTMTGVEGNGNAYTIVKGGGIPAITVMGYNRRVDWNELISRLKRVLQENLKAVVK